MLLRVVEAFLEALALLVPADVQVELHDPGPARGERCLKGVYLLVPKSVWEQRYEQINSFEATLAASGTRIVKVYLHISRDEQRERFQKRLDNPEKHWKWSSGDLETRDRWDDFQSAYADAMERCSTVHAPWFVVPANHKWYRDLAVAEILVEAAREMDPQWPEVQEDLSAVVIPD